MAERIRRERTVFIWLFIVWLATKSGVADLPAAGRDVRAAINVAELICLGLSTIYLFRLFRWLNSPRMPAWAVTIIYFVFDFFVPLVSALIGAGIIWGTEKKLESTADAIKGSV